jgi:molecular chaperone IbpA
VFQAEQGTVGYPPYNIVKLGDDDYRISMAVAGFTENDLDVTVRDNQVVVNGKVADSDDASATYFHRGIATRAFERKFNLADYVKVVNATLSNGLLEIDLARDVPEAMKPRQIAIRSKPGSSTKVIEGQAAA